MNEAIGEIGRRAGEAAVLLGFAPQRGRHDFIYQIHGLGHIDGESVIAGQAWQKRATFAALTLWLEPKIKPGVGRS